MKKPELHKVVFRVRTRGQAWALKCRAMDWLDEQGRRDDLVASYYNPDLPNGQRELRFNFRDRDTALMLKLSLT